jgi:hypothetical protein
VCLPCGRSTLYTTAVKQLSRSEAQEFFLNRGHYLHSIVIIYDEMISS